MADRPRNRQELYDRIRETSKDEVILEDMVRLGFWPQRGAVPHDPADEIRQRGDLERQIAALRTEQARLQNIDAIRTEMRKRRLAESKKKQKETKLRRERERLERAAAWADEKKRRITYLGIGVSAGLSKGAPAKPEVLAQHGLPALETAAQIAAAIGIGVGELRFLAFARKTSQRTHYVRFQIPKKVGGTRLISAPMPRLKRAQRWLLDQVLNKVALHEAAHGFVVARSIVTNARPHVGANVVVNIDLKEFFPTFTFRRIKGMFEALGYGEEAATIFALLASEPEVDEVELDGLSYFVARGARKLPQGSPASPAITNVICRRLDKRLEGMARSVGFVYTRYADDLTFSAKTAEAGANVGKLLRRVRYAVAAEGFVPHEKKTRILRRGRRQEVTGVVVNEKPAIARDVLKRFRALLFQLDKDGPAGKRWGNREGTAVLSSAVGFASYVAMVDPERGKPLLETARAVARKHGWTPPVKPPPRGGPTGGGGVPVPQAPAAIPPAYGAPLPAPQQPAMPEPAPPAPTPPEPAPGEPKKKWWKIF
ncbi:MAG TPA: reverse transcriptase family protein [Labilithrix sp.]|nr:reverse transcriptase family protein [Labilithrix sp.]